ncbi:MAG: hypothetical protein M3463_12170 [Verrucomicrobiota bacterium]|nr:hypothetical protein [Verrucomicrobiota bacterium]
MELLLAIAVLALLVVLVTQLTDSARITTSASEKRVAADNHARTVFNRMARDFEGMLKRKDVDYLFTKNPGNDTMYFYSEAPGYFSASSQDPRIQSPVTLVGYLVPADRANRNDNYVVERLARGLNWAPNAHGSTGNQGTVTFLTYPAGATPAATPHPNSTLAKIWPSYTGPAPRHDAAPNTGWRQVISDAVYRMEFCFQMKDGTFLAPQNPTEMRRLGSDVAVIIVTIALLDSRSRVIVGDDMEDAVTALADGNDPTVATVWTTQINKGAVGIRQPAAASQVRVYQRFFYLDRL